jgi:hypothetical protein
MTINGLRVDIFLGWVIFKLVLQKEAKMFEWLCNCLKNKYLKVILYLIGLGLIALWLGAPLNAVISVFLIIVWISYIYLAIKKSTILSPTEKNLAYICLFALSLLSLATVRSFKEVLTLLLFMASRGDIALIAWFAAGKGFWPTAIAHTCLATIGLMVIYLTTDLLKSQSEKHLPKLLMLLTQQIQKIIRFFLRERNIARMFRETREIFQFLKLIRQAYRKKLSQWIEKRKLLVVFIIYLIPVPIPYLPTIIIVTVRARNIKYGLWPLLLASFLRGLIFVWLVWQGFIHL